MPSKSKPLTEYKRKRDFSKTDEPAGEVGSASPRRPLQFVVQKHAASHLHYDFRLELDGVMKSWAVPKGPSFEPSQKRLAMEVEDHPMEYNTFEGTIPKGQYGGGTVMLWDRGVYDAADGGGSDSVREGYRRGDLKIVMLGERLKGGWVLVRTRRESARNQWLLIKHRDEFVKTDYDIGTELTTSVESGRTMEEIAANRRGRVWNSNRDETVEAGEAKPTKRAAKKRTAKKPSAKKPPVRKTATKKGAKKSRKRAARAKSG